MTQTAEKQKVLERRTAKRKILGSPLNVFEENVDEPIGQITSVTPDSITLRSDRLIKTQSLFRLFVELPGMLFRTRRVALDAKSIWCRREDDFHTYHAGFQLQNLNPKTQKSIQAIVERFRQYT